MKESVCLLSALVTTALLVGCKASPPGPVGAGLAVGINDAPKSPSPSPGASAPASRTHRRVRQDGVRRHHFLSKSADAGEKDGFARS